MTMILVLLEALLTKDTEVIPTSNPCIAGGTLSSSTIVQQHGMKERRATLTVHFLLICAADFREMYDVMVDCVCVW